MFNLFKTTLPSVWVIHDGSHRQQQATALADALGAPYHMADCAEITDAYIKKHTAPQIIIGAGADTADAVLRIKQLNKNKPYAISILNPQKHHDDFDMIIVPDYEPHHQGDNVITTTGLLVKTTTARLEQARDDYTNNIYPELTAANLTPPYVTVLIGGDYIGGKFDSTQVIHFCEKLNQLAKLCNANLLITTSSRTNVEMTDVMKQHLTANYFLYDYFHYRHMKNPYEVMLSLADEVVVTGDSIRMLCEAAATGKPIHIVEPEADFQPYAPLYQQLYDSGYAKKCDGSPADFTPKAPLNEADRVAGIIQKIDPSLFQRRAF